MEANLHTDLFHYIRTQRQQNYDSLTKKYCLLVERLVDILVTYARCHVTV